MINSFIFPAPERSSYTVDRLRDEAPQSGGIRCITLHIPPMIPPLCGGDGGDAHHFSFGVLLQHPSSPFLVLYAHPNAVDVGMMVEEMQYFARKAQVSVLLWEYHGYGVLKDDVDVVGSQPDAPEPGEEVLVDGMAAVYLYAIKELHVPSTQIILMGRSIGTGPSTFLAASTANAATPAADEPGGRRRGSNEGAEVSCLPSPAPLPPPLLLFLQAPFSSITECVHSVLAQQKMNLSFLQPLAGMMIADRFRNVDVIGSVPCHVLIQHGDRDSIVPHEHAVRLVQAAIRQGKDASTLHLHTSTGYNHNNLSVHEAAQILLHTLRSEVLRVAWSPHPLQLRVPLFHGAQRSVYRLLTRSQETTPPGDSAPWRSLAHFHDAVRVRILSTDHVRETQHLGGGGVPESFSSSSEIALHMLCGRSTTVPILLAGLSSFICRLAYVWSHIHPIEQKIAFQGRTTVRKRPFEESHRSSLRRVFEELIAVGGSPLGIYTSPGAFFGITFSPAGGCVCGTPLVELRWPTALIRDVLCMVELLVGQVPPPTPPAAATRGASSSVPTDDVHFYPFASADAASIPFALSGPQLDCLQLHVERILGFMPDREWVALQQLVRGGGVLRLREAATAPTRSLEDISEAAASLRQRQVTEQTNFQNEAGSFTEEWCVLLRQARQCATACGFHQYERTSDGAIVVDLDAAWPTARSLHREVLACLRSDGSGGCQASGGDDRPSVPSPTRVAVKRKSDEDCSMM